MKVLSPPPCPPAADAPNRNRVVGHYSQFVFFQFRLFVEGEVVGALERCDDADE